MGAIRAGLFAALVVLAGLAMLSRTGSAVEKGDSDRHVQGEPFLVFPDHFDTSPPLWQMALEAEEHPSQGEAVQSTPLRRGRPPLVSSGPDSALQPAAPKISTVSTTSFSEFEGLCNQTPPVVPADANASVGSTQIVETINNWLGIYTKNGTLLVDNGLGRVFSYYTGPCDPQDPNGAFIRRWADPVVLYDKQANRWIINYIAWYTTDTTYYVCQGVSTSSDATGTWNRMAFAYPAQNFNGTYLPVVPDYPKLGVWPDAYYATYNMFRLNSDGSDTFLGAQVCAFNRSAWLAGSPAPGVCVQRSPSDFSLLPADVDGVAQPVGGEPNFLVEIASPGALNLFRFQVDFNVPSNSKLLGPFAVQNVASFSETCGGRAGCIPQPPVNGTTTYLDGLGDRLMHRLAYRKFSDHESLVTTHSVAAGSSVGVRWYEIRCPNGGCTPTTTCPDGSKPCVYQQGTWAPDSSFRWMGSIAMDGSGNIALGYSVSSGSVYPSIRFTGRAPGDTLGKMQGENVIVDGQASQYGFSCDTDPNCASRWGDYTSMAIDPVDDATFVYTNVYYPTVGTACTYLNGIGGTVTNNTAPWRTRIAKFTMPQVIAGAKGHK